MQFPPHETNAEPILLMYLILCIIYIHACQLTVSFFAFIDTLPWAPLVKTVLENGTSTTKNSTGNL